MYTLPFAAAGIHDFWYTLPLVVVVSLVYAATRHEQVGLIFTHAVRIGIWIAGFMAVIFSVLLLISWRL